MIAQERERAGPRDGGVLLSKTARGGIARIGELLGASVALSLVESEKVRLGDEDLAAHLDPTTVRFAELFWKVRNRAHVVGNVLAHSTVTPSGALDQYTVHVGDRKSEAIDLWLHRERERRSVRAQAPRGPFGPGGQLVDVKDVVQTEHRFGVADLAEHRR